jgi:hypothetical protein
MRVAEEFSAEVAMIKRILVVATPLALVAAALGLWAGETLAPSAASANMRPLAIAELLAKAREDVRKPERKSLATILLPRGARPIEQGKTASIKKPAPAGVKDLAASLPSAVPEPTADPVVGASKSDQAPTLSPTPPTEPEARAVVASASAPDRAGMPVPAGASPVAPDDARPQAEIFGANTEIAAAPRFRSIGAARDNVPNAFGLNPAVDVEQLSEAMARRAFAGKPPSGLASLSGEGQPPVPLSGTVSVTGTDANEADDSGDIPLEQQDQVTAFQTAAVGSDQP